jgi:integrase
MWSETDLARHSLTVIAQLVQYGWDIEESDPKTGSDSRVVALDDDTIQVLERRRKRQRADRAAWASGWVDTGLVFTEEDGSWLHPGKITDRFEGLVASSELPTVRLHDLRHGAATLMLTAGVDVKVVSGTLGHSDTRITCDIYQSVFPEVAKKPPKPPPAWSRSNERRRPRKPRAGKRRRRRRASPRTPRRPEARSRTRPLTHDSR